MKYGKVRAMLKKEGKRGGEKAGMLGKNIYHKRNYNFAW